MNYFWLFALINLIPVALVVLTNPLRGVSRLVAPDTLVVVMLYAIFAVRPLYTDRFASPRAREWYFGITPTAEGQLTASIIGMVLLWGIAIGVIWRTEWRKSSVIREELSSDLKGRADLEQDTSSRLPTGIAIIVTLIALALYFAVLMRVIGLSGILAMSGGRSAAAHPASVPEIVMQLPLAGSVASATLILTARTSKINAASWIVIAFCTVASIVTVSQLGSRRLMIPAILIVVTALLMRKPVRLRFWHLAAGSVAFLALMTMPMVRGAGGRDEGEGIFAALARAVGETGPVNAVEYFVTSYDTIMYDYIAVLASELENGRLKLGLGSGTIVEFLAHPFPANMTPFLERSSELKAHIFHYSCFGPDCPVRNPVISVGGTLFFDWWHLGVLIGGIIVGFVVRAIAFRWSRAASLSTSQNLITAVCASYAMIAARTDTVWAIWWCIYTIIIALLVLAAMGEGEVLAKLRGGRGAPLADIDSRDT
ncbi:hypothetical protein ABQF17_07285 [Mycolicibacterium elephantis]